MRVKTKIVLWLIAITLPFIAAASYLHVFSMTPGPGRGDVKEIDIQNGAGPKKLASTLKEAGIISNTAVFAIWLRTTGKLRYIKAGLFKVPNNSTPAQVIDILSGKGTAKGIKITVPEGFTLTRIQQALKAAGLVNVKGFIEEATAPKLTAGLGITGPSAEGFLFPDTYYFDKSDTAFDVIAKMYGNFKEKIKILDIPKSANINDIVTLASIVQAEAKAADEMPIIAGVYSNRLASPKFLSRLLQADPTTAYGCEPFVKPNALSCASFTGTLLRSQLSDPTNPYNTYQRPGLPPGPICAPGLDALKAALRPAQHSYFYFVLNENGRHTFSSTLEEHQKAVEKYRMKN